MTEINYINMLEKLLRKTEEKKAIWQKGSRSNDFLIAFQKGSLVIDKWFDDSDKTILYYDFAIYNNNGDQIYYSKADTNDWDIFKILEALHDSVLRSYYKVDETIQNFSAEIEGDEIIGKKSNNFYLPPDEDLPF